MATLLDKFAWFLARVAINENGTGYNDVGLRAQNS